MKSYSNTYFVLQIMLTFSKFSGRDSPTGSTRSAADFEKAIHETGTFFVFFSMKHNLA